MGLELVRGACPGPLEMGALTVNGSRRKAAYGWPMGYGITVSGYRTRLTVPDIYVCIVVWLYAWLIFALDGTYITVIESTEKGSVALSASVRFQGTHTRHFWDLGKGMGLGRGNGTGSRFDSTSARPRLIARLLRLSRVL